MRSVVVCAIASLVLTAGEASAQTEFRGYFTGHIGAISGGELSSQRLAAGAAIAVQEENGWGAEMDFGFSTDATSGAQILDITSYMINAKWVKPAGMVRPFAVAGGGVLSINGCDAPCNRAARTNDLGFTAGAGAYVALHDSFGVRADARYFFSSADHPDLRRPDNFSFWRLSIGATFMWAMVD